MKVGSQNNMESQAKKRRVKTLQRYKNTSVGQEMAETKPNSSDVARIPFKHAFSLFLHRWWSLILDILYYGLNVFFLTLIMHKPYEIEWNVVIVLIVSELGIIIAQIPERLSGVTLSPSLLASAAADIRRGMIPQQDTSFVCDMTPDYREVGILVVLTHIEILESLNNVFYIPSETLSAILSFTPEVAASIMVLVMFMRFYNNMKAHKRDITLNEMVESFRLFNMIEVVFHVLVILYCSPIDWVMHKLAMSVFITVSIQVFMVLAKSLLRLAPPKAQRLFKQVLSKLLK